MTKDLNYEMLRIRMVEERIAQEYPKGEMRCPVHLSIGQEAAAVGVAAALRPSDKMVSTHRGHAHYLAKGGSLKGLIGELYGKAIGCSRGNGGSMHLIDLGVDFWGSTSIVGGTIPVGVGLAFADRLKGTDQTTVVCIGDAAVEQGVFHEAANFASLHKLKVLFVCENNLYSCYTHLLNRQPKRSFKAVAAGHALAYRLITKPDVYEIARQVNSLRRWLPAFIEIPTYRHLQHCGPDNDDHLNYRDPAETKKWMSLDFAKDPRHAYVIKREIDEVFAEVKAAPYPAEDEVGKYVYATNNHI